MAEGGGTAEGGTVGAESCVGASATVVAVAGTGVAGGGGIGVGGEPAQANRIRVNVARATKSSGRLRELMFLSSKSELQLSGAY